MRLIKWIAIGLILLSSTLCFGASTDRWDDNNGVMHSYDVITKGPLVDVRSFMDGLSGRPTHATWYANQTTTDVTVVIQAAINSVTYGAGTAPGLGSSPTILLPHGIFKITDSLDFVGTHNINFIGLGPTSIIDFRGGNKPAFNISGVNYPTFKNFQIIAINNSGDGTNTIALYLRNVTYGLFENIWAYAFAPGSSGASKSLKLYGSGLDPLGASSVTQTDFIKCHFYSAGIGAWIYGVVNTVNFIVCSFESTTLSVLLTETTDMPRSVHLKGCTYQSNYADLSATLQAEIGGFGPGHINIYHGYNVSVEDSYFENAGAGETDGYHVAVGAKAYNTKIKNNHFIGSAIADHPAIDIFVGEGSDKTEIDGNVHTDVSNQNLYVYGGTNVNIGPNNKFVGTIFIPEYGATRTFTPTDKAISELVDFSGTAITKIVHCFRQKARLTRAYIVFDTEDNNSTSNITVGKQGDADYFVTAVALSATKNQYQQQDLTIANHDIAANDVITFSSAGSSGQDGEGRLVIEWFYE
jgi:hypothetical protein